ncbi:hypothetical protein CAJAP_08048 [Camponotus japonicus]
MNRQQRRRSVRDANTLERVCFRRRRRFISGIYFNTSKTEEHVKYKKKRVNMTKRAGYYNISNNSEK